MAITLTTLGRDACLAGGGLNAAIIAGTAVTYPYVKITTSGGGTDLLTINLDATNALTDTGDGEATMQRPGAASWTDYQQNADGTGNAAEFGVYNRDNQLVFSGSVGLGTGDWPFTVSIGFVSGSPVSTNAPVLTKAA